MRVGSSLIHLLNLPAIQEGQDLNNFFTIRFFIGPFAFRSDLRDPSTLFAAWEVGTTGFIEFVGFVEFVEFIGFIGFIGFVELVELVGLDGVSTIESNRSSNR